MECMNCESNPCLWKLHKDSIIEQVEQIAATSDYFSNNEKSKLCYRLFTREIHGILTVGNRRELPECIVENIRTKCPNMKGEEFVGFHQN